MSASLRRLLACLLLVALPWQGVAAAAMVLCHPASHADTASKNERSAHASHGAGHDASHDPHHGHPALADGSASAVAGHPATADDGAGLQADAGHRCGACSLCGHVVALPAPSVTLLAAPAPQCQVTGTGLHPGSRVVSLPDKPPRA